ncbi:MAG TPA: helix-turn-helix domain-containing protein, partial [Candidatus Thermoplasmatota archaeon]|nr:helix-turn-helix domain-containing protein [Candidatus Thermoplasmatota archaeon]
FRYHLDVLERAGLVRRERAGRLVLLLPVEDRASADALLAGRGRAGELLRLLAERREATVREAAAALGLDHQLVYHHLKTLLGLGLVEARPGRPARYRLARR